jgi:hypothetical protein
MKWRLLNKLPLGSWRSVNVFVLKGPQVPIASGIQLGARDFKLMHCILHTENRQVGIQATWLAHQLPA